MSLMSQLAEVRVPQDDELQGILFDLQLRIDRCRRAAKMGSKTVAKRVTDSSNTPFLVQQSLASALSEVQDQVTLIKSWAYNACLIGD